MYTVDRAHIILWFDRTHYMRWNVVKGYKIIGGVYDGLRHEAVWLER